MHVEKICVQAIYREVTYPKAMAYLVFVHSMLVFMLTLTVALKRRGKRTLALVYFTAHIKLKW